MLKKNKIILSMVASGIGIGGIVTTSLIPVILKSNSNNTIELHSRMSVADWNNNSTFEFNGKDYINLNDAYDDLVNQIGGIQTQQFIGEINNKNEDGSIILDNNAIEKYDLDKITTAYMDANGRLTNDYDKALTSFVNASTLVANYYDYKGNYFLDEEDAKYSMNSFSTMGVAYYEVNDSNNNPVKINPLNSDDINKFKEIAYDWIVNKPNDPQNPFKLKLVGEDQQSSSDPTYSKTNEITSALVNQWTTFKNEFKNNLKNELIKIINNVLTNNQIIKAEIYIKPYVLEQGDQSKKYDNLDSTIVDSVSERFMWYFNYNGNTQLSVQSKAINLNDFNQLCSILMNRDQFVQNFNIYENNFETKHIDGWNTKYETAAASWQFLNKFLEPNSSLSVLASMPKMNVSSIWHSQEKVTARILTNSDTYHDSGPNFKNNYMLTFGIRPYIDPNAKVVLDSWKDDFQSSNATEAEMRFSDFMNSLVTNNNSKSTTTSSNLLFQEYVYRKTLESIKTNNIDIYNFLQQFSYSDVVGDKNILGIVSKINENENSKPQYTSNIFNANVVGGIDEAEDQKGTTPQFSQLVYSKLCDKFNIPKDKYDEFNSAIDMHQLTYYDTKQNCNYINNYFLGDNSNFLNNFVNIGNINPKISTTFGNLKNNFKYIVTYNDMPVFEINSSIDINEYKFLLDNMLNKTGFTTKSISLTTPNDLPNLIHSLFNNISTSYHFADDKTRSNKSNNYVINNTTYVKYVDDNPNLINVDNTSGFIATYNHLPSDNSAPAVMNRGIYDAVSLYNQNIQKLDLLSNNSNVELLDMNKPTEFLMLFNKASDDSVTPTPLKYCETYSGVDNINLVLTNLNINVKLANNYQELSELKERLKVFNTPIKVYFIYHNNNLLIPYKIEYNGNNPDYVDSPELVIQNALRTYGLAPETRYVMYNTGNGYVSLLNNVFVLYKIQLADHDYYFDSYANTKNKLISYIKYNAYKI